LKVKIKKGKSFFEFGGRGRNVLKKANLIFEKMFR